MREKIGSINKIKWLAHLVHKAAQSKTRDLAATEHATRPQNQPNPTLHTTPQLHNSAQFCTSHDPICLKTGDYACRNRCTRLHNPRPARTPRSPAHRGDQFLLHVIRNVGNEKPHPSSSLSSQPIKNQYLPSFVVLRNHLFFEPASNFRNRKESRAWSSRRSISDDSKYVFSDGIARQSTAFWAVTDHLDRACCSFEGRGSRELAVRVSETNNRSLSPPAA
jgi:hypothetical protein